MLGMALSPFPDATLSTAPQLIFLGIVYGYVLLQAAVMLSEGSELLLLIPRLAPCVGKIILPMLGALPEIMLILFSGLGSDAQSQISVGVGALAGSTIMLLTLPWFFAVSSGRVSIRDGEATYARPPHEAGGQWAKLMPEDKASLSNAGVGLSPTIKRSARMMLFTLIGYVIVQVAAFIHTPTMIEASGEGYFALAGLAVCALGLIIYLWVCAKQNVDDVVVDVTLNALSDGSITLRGALVNLRAGNLSRLCDEENLEKALISGKSWDEATWVAKVLTPLWYKYDVNGDNRIDFAEFCMLFADFNESVPCCVLQQMFKAADDNNDQYIDFEEFVACIMCFAVEEGNELKAKEGDDSADMPEEFVGIAPAEQRRRILMRALAKMAIGVLLVLAFSNPMVDLLYELGDRLSISPFYISFLLAPIASNSSELVAARYYGSKRTLSSITTSLSTLTGAAIMNNTLCLGVLLGLVYFKHLAWEFSAETIAIVVVQVLVGLVVLTRKVLTVKSAYVVLALYPGAVLLVWVLENKCGFD